MTAWTDDNAEWTGMSQFRWERPLGCGGVVWNMSGNPVFDLQLRFQVSIKFKFRRSSLKFQVSSVKSMFPMSNLKYEAQVSGFKVYSVARSL